MLLDPGLTIRMFLGNQLELLLVGFKFLFLCFIIFVEKKRGETPGNLSYNKI